MMGYGYILRNLFLANFVTMKARLCLHKHKISGSVIQHTQELFLANNILQMKDLTWKAMLPTPCLWTVELVPCS